MSIASHADTFGSPDALPAGAATSRLDRELASLAGLSAAIRDEIAQSLAPMKADLERARKLVSMLEIRVRDLEARQAANTVDNFNPDMPDYAPGRAIETPPESTPERAVPVVVNFPTAADETANGAPNQLESASVNKTQGGFATATETASHGGAQAHDPITSSAATGAVAEQQLLPVSPTRRKSQRKTVAAKRTTVAPAPAVTITVVLSPLLSASAGPVSLALAPFPENSETTVSFSLAAAATTPAAPIVDTPAPGSEPSQPAGAVADLLDQAPAVDDRSELVHAASGPSVAAALPILESYTERGPSAARAMPCDHAAGLLHPLLEKGARELIASGLYPDMATLLDEAVYRLLESDYPAKPLASTEVVEFSV